MIDLLDFPIFTVICLILALDFLTGFLLSRPRATRAVRVAVLVVSAVAAFVLLGVSQRASDAYARAHPVPIRPGSPPPLPRVQAVPFALGLLSMGVGLGAFRAVWGSDFGRLGRRRVALELPPIVGSPHSRDGE